MIPHNSLFPINHNFIPIVDGPPKRSPKRSFKFLKLRKRSKIFDQAWETLSSAKGILVCYVTLPGLGYPDYNPETVAYPLCCISFRLIAGHVDDRNSAKLAESKQTDLKRTSRASLLLPLPLRTVAHCDIKINYRFYATDYRHDRSCNC